MSDQMTIDVLEEDSGDDESTRGAEVPVYPGGVHPLAAMFPMMSANELSDLAEDIRQNGLLNPIVRDEKGRLVDGRNRYAAWVIAAVEPAYRTLNGHEEVAFILSQNVARRHLTKGQQAIIVAQARKTVKDTVSITETALAYGLGESLLGRANVVLKHAADLATSVVTGVMSLQDAYDEARFRKEAAETDEVRFERLQRTNPDLAAMVQEEQLSLAAALVEAAERRAAEQERKRRERVALEMMARNWNEALIYLDPRNLDVSGRASELVGLSEDLLGVPVDWSADRVRRIIALLEQYVSQKERSDE